MRTDQHSITCLRIRVKISFKPNCEVDKPNIKLVNAAMFPKLEAKSVISVVLSILKEHNCENRSLLYYLT